LLSKCICSN